MFKSENQIWLWLIGIIAMFVVLFSGSVNLLIPFFDNPNSSALTNLRYLNPPRFDINTEIDYYVEVQTNLGTFSIDLFEKSAPENVNNFIYLVDRDYYDSTKVSRVISNFLIQLGDINTLNDDPNDDGRGKTGYFIDDEISWDYLRLSSEKRTVLTELGYRNTSNLETPEFDKYFVGMANAGPDTNSAQFFILTSNRNDIRIQELNGLYTPIGRVINGFNIIDLINGLEVDNIDSISPRPIEDVIIQDIRILTK